jgi:hypothetical protein
MSKLLVHIGPPKTGSTTLQALFSYNSEELSRSSIAKLNPKLKEVIREYFRIFRQKDSMNWGEKALPSWFLNCSESCFIKRASHTYGLFSEEALFKLFMHENELFLFDRFLSRFYDERIYFAVLREINTYTTSQLSQAIKGLWMFDYKICKNKLKRFSLDRLFGGVLDADFRLELSTFGNLVVDPESTRNISSFLENIFGISCLNLMSVQGVKNKSLGAEGVAIRLVYNNVMRMLLQKDEFARQRIGVRNSGRSLNRKIIDHFPVQRAFCPFNENEQSKYQKRHLKESKRFIRKFPGSWVNEVFTPVVREKAVAFVSELDSFERNMAVDILEDHICGLLEEGSFAGQPIAYSEVREALTFFLKNEKKIVF